MEENPKKKKRSKGVPPPNSFSEKPTKEELMIAKYLRTKLPIREGKLALMVVNIFDGNEAVNALLASKWATGSNKYPLLFPNRHYAVEYLKFMMQKNLFHRAIKVKKKSKKKQDDKVNSNKKKSDDTKPTKESKKKSKEGKKARMKLEFHDIQIFNPDDPDGDDIYVWIYEPFNPWKFLLGGVVLLVILGFCLFPIWPAQLRSVTYYGSIGLMGILGLLIGLVVLRAVIFSLVWLLTLGRHHFWFLPNLTEDCGVVDSFKPLYLHEYNYNNSTNGKKKSSKKSTSAVKDSKNPSKSKSEVENDKEDENSQNEDELAEDNGDVYVAEDTALSLGDKKEQ